MSFVVLIAQKPVIGAVFSPTLETFIVGAFVLIRQLIVVPVVRGVPIIFIIVSKRGDDRYTHHKHCCC